MGELKPIIEQSFNQYAGAVLQSRALIDSRDCIKPSARQILYSMHERKLVHNKPHKKTANAVGMAMADYYIHGDASCEGIIMRAGQSFSMRYPLTDVKGNAGSLIKSGNWAAMRYTESRTSALMEAMFGDIEKNTIDDWRDNYDNTKQYPGVLPSKGFYNICNGSFGIGIGMSSSIPQFNLKEVNAALEKLLLNPNIPDDDIIIMPDFATGACLLNPSEVKESLKNGNGKSCLLRSVINYDAKDNCLVVTEIPYSVYTNTIIAEIDAILQGEDNPGIDSRNDLTGKTPLIKIYLTKNANPQTVLKYLYKNTSLQYWYAINLTMLENGRYPKLFTWKEALQSHIEHEKVVYRRGFEYDKNKAEDRLHIVEGLLIALANIDEVVHTIKTSSSVAVANELLREKFILTDIQAKAILDMKLSRLAHLEVEKLEKEKVELLYTINQILLILNNENLFNEQIIKGWREVSEKFGDERRTKITPMEEEETPKLNNKNVVVMVTDANEVIVTDPFDKINAGTKTHEWYKKKFKTGCMCKLLDTIYAYGADGRIYNINPFKTTDVTDCVGLFTTDEKKYILHVTNKGTVKKSLITEYSGFKRNPVVGKLRDGESVVFVGAANDEDYLLMLGVNGKVSKVLVSDFTATGRNTIGVKGMAVGVVSACIASENDHIGCISDEKYKITVCSDYSISGKNALGYAIAENTTTLTTIPKKEFYLIENGVKITHFGASEYTPKGKSAQGNKTTKDTKFIW